MEQVPRNRASGPLRYGLIGRGRLACHLAFYWNSFQIPFVHWHRGLNLPPEEILSNADVLALAISDKALEGFIDQHPKLNKKTFIHFSGAHVSDRALSFHPLASFTHSLFSPELYPLIPFIGEQGQPHFQDLFPTLTNPYYAIRSCDKVRYHAACVMGGNFSTLLWKRFQTSVQSIGLPPEIAEVYMKTVLENLLNNPDEALTGPLVRRDDKTIQSHLHALSGDSYETVYRAFLKAEYPEFL